MQLMKILYTHWSRLLLGLIATFTMWPNANAQIFYKIEKPGVERPSYLFGTHHMAPVSMLDNFPTLPTALQGTETIVSEIDQTAMAVNPAKSQAILTAPPDSCLNDLFTPEEYKILSDRLGQLPGMKGFSLDIFNSMRPMALTALITVNLFRDLLPGNSLDNPLDIYLQQLGAESGHDIVGLETIDQQLTILYRTVPLAKQAENLRQLILNPDETITEAQKLNDAYFSQSLDSLYEISSSEDTDPEFMQALLKNRNKAWMGKLPAIIDHRPALIVVGALHLAGNDGLIALLQNAGYSVTPLDYAPALSPDSPTLIKK